MRARRGPTSDDGAPPGFSRSHPRLADAAIDAAEDGDLDLCERLASQALDLADALPGGSERDRAMAQALRPRGTAERARGRYVEAEATFERAAALATTGFGRELLEVAELLNDLGMTFKYAGRFADAERAYQETRTILEAIDADPEDLAALYHNLGGLAHVRRDFAGAEELSRRAIEIRSSALGPRHPATLLDRSAHAAIFHGLGRHDEAEASIRDILGDLEAALGADHPEMAVTFNNLAAIVQRRGDLPQAEELYPAGSSLSRRPAWVPTHRPSPCLSTTSAASCVRPVAPTRPAPRSSEPSDCSRAR